MPESEDDTRWKELLTRDELKSPSFWRELHEEEIRRRYGRRHPPIRARVFTDELKDLASRIRSHRPEAAVSSGEGSLAAATTPGQGESASEPSALDVPGSTQPGAGAFQPLSFEDVSRELPDTFQRIMRLHAGSERNIPGTVLEDLVEETGASSAAVLLFSRQEAVFETVCSTGLDRQTTANLWLPAHDPFVESGSVQWIPIAPELKANPFFRKRFHEEFLERLEAMLFCHRPDLFYPAVLLLFFEKGDALRQRPSDESLQQRLDWLHPLLVRRAEQMIQASSQRNIYGRVAREVRAFLALRQGTVLMKFMFDRMLETDVGARLMHDIRQHLSHGRNCLVLRIRHDTLKLLTSDPPTERAALLRTIETLASGFGVGVRHEETPVGPEAVSSMVL